MRLSTLPRPVFDIKGWTTQSSLHSPGLSSDNGSDGILLDFVLLRPRKLKFIKFLGAGAFGAVYLAVDIDGAPCPGDQGLVSSVQTASGASLPSGSRLPRYYAVKCMNNQLVSRRKRSREVTTHRAVLGHPSVLGLYACVQQDGWTFLVLEYAEDGDMSQCMLDLNAYAPSDEKIGSAFGQVVDAVHYCHRQGVFHRDIKPENILCRKDGLELALGDFGLATMQATNVDFGTGSKSFMSPECLKHGYLAHNRLAPDNWKPKPFDTAKNDVWCLGMLLMSIISNSTPWERANNTDKAFMLYLQKPLALREAFPISWAAFDLLHRMLDVNPESRISIPLLKNKLRHVRTFRMTPWELENASQSAQLGAEAWYPPNYMRPRPQPWTRYETYPEHLDASAPPASQLPDIDSNSGGRPDDWPSLWEVESCGTPMSEDIVPGLVPLGRIGRNQTSLPITPAAAEDADPLIAGERVPEMDLADGLDAYADRLRIERWRSDCAGALGA